MQAFREMISGWLGKTLLAVITLGMAGLTISNYFVSNNRPVVAEVNGQKIYKTDFDRLYQTQRNQIMQRMGGSFDPSLVDDDKLRASVLKDLINQELIVQAANKANFLVGDAVFSKWQQSQSMFLEDGKFSQQRYLTALQQAGQDPATFPQYFKTHMAASELADSIAHSSFALRPELLNLATLDAEKRDVSLASIDPALFASGQTASDAEVKKYYGDNPKRFTAEEEVALDYIELSRDDFLAQATVSDEDLQARYQDYIKNLSESRHAQHILITVDKNTSDADALKKIKDIEKRARAGEDFSALAKQYSQDPGSVSSGGDLGFYTRGGGFVKPFEDAMFGLKVGEISAPVKTQFGYHLIKLLEIKKPDVPTLDSLKPQLETEAKAAKADELFSDAAEKLDAAVYEASDLKDPAAKFKLPIQSTPSFSHAGMPGIASNHNVLGVAFSDDLVKEGKNSQAIRLDDSHAVWVHVKSHQAEHMRPLEEVTGEARGLVILDKATAQAKSVADAAVAALNSGKSLDEVAAANHLTWQSFPGIDHRGDGKGAPTPDQLKVAFRLPKPAAGKISAGTVPDGNAVTVIAVSKIAPGVPNLPEAELSQIAGVVGENIAQYELMDYVAYLRANATIKTYDIKADAAPAQ